MHEPGAVDANVALEALVQVDVGFFESGKHRTQSFGVTATDAVREEITARGYTTTRTLLKQEFNREIPTLKMYWYFI